MLRDDGAWTYSGQELKLWAYTCSQCIDLIYPECLFRLNFEIPVSDPLKGCM